MRAIINKWLVGVALLLTAGWANAQATVYTATSGVYSGKFDIGVCVVGPCQNYTLAMSASGSFTTASPLAGNLVNTDVSASVTAFTFSDGINTYSSTDGAVRIFQFSVTTDPSGEITSSDVVVELWQTGTSPHAVNDRFAFIRLANTSNVYNNNPCGNVGVSIAGTPDTCLFDSVDSGSSSAAGGAVSWTRVVAAPTPQSIPTLSEWGLIIASTLVGLVGFAAMRRRRI